MKTEDVDPKKKKDITFANDVVILMDLLYEGSFDRIVAYDSNEDRLDAEKKLAKTLYYIRSLLLSQANFVNEEERIENLQANSLVEAILANKQHSIWAFIDGQRAMQQGKRTPTTWTLLHRALVLALVQLLRDEGSTRAFHDAAVLLEAEFELGLTADNLRNWARTKDSRSSAMVASHIEAIDKRAREDGLGRKAVALIWIGQRIEVGLWNTRG